MPTDSKTSLGVRVTVIGALLSVALAAWWVTERLGSRSSLSAAPPLLRYQASDKSLDDLPEELLSQVEVPYQHEVNRGETLVGLFEKLGLERQEANRATFAIQEHLDPRQLKAGMEYAVYRKPDDSIGRVVFPIGRDGEVHLTSSYDHWQSEWRDYQVERRRRTTSAVLAQDLSSALAEAGAPVSLAIGLADVLQWDLDFNRDLRRGDEFSVAYDALYINGRLRGIDTVQAVIYRNQGRLLEAYRFGDEGGYYDGSGRPLRKQFLKSPLPFTRVTSRFSNSRLHPVLKVRRPHYGVDYGAPTGTPVRVTAGGVVTFRARTKGGGNMVTVRHTNNFETSYLHLSKFHANSCKGCRVRQGDLIGYVGSTGLATAPHLDYRVKRNGRYMDPLQLRSQPAPTLQGSDLARFLAERDVQRLALQWQSEVSPSWEESVPAP